MAERTTTAALTAIVIGSLPTGCAPTPDDGLDPAPGPNAAAVETHIERARTLAAADLTAPFEFFCVPGNARGTNRDGPSIVPVQLFDNLHVFGNADTVVYAITTSDGIVLIDSGYPGTTETVIVPGLEALDLDPADVRLVLLGHGHADHYGGAAYFQDRYGARVGSADWTLMAEVDSSAATPPQRDLVVEDRVAIVHGDTRIMPIAIPGHTDGSLAFVFDVTDRGTRHTAGLFGGTILLADRITTAGLEQYVSSIERYVGIARDMGVDVEIQNHPLFDDTPTRLEALGHRTPGEPHPFQMSTERYARFWQIIGTCLQAEIARRSYDGA